MLLLYVAPGTDISTILDVYCVPSGMKFSPKLLPTVISALELCGGFRDEETDGDVGEDEGGCLEDEGG